MAIWSSLKLLLPRSGVVSASTARRCMSSHRTFPIEPSRWQWHKFKDLLHFYVLLGAIPVGAVIFYSNVFIGPATLSEIPEDYVPKHWEYYRHPITRFIARYILTPPQQEYEKLLHYLYEEDERRKLRKIEDEIREKLKKRSDYQAYYYKPVLGKYHRASRESAEDMLRVSGD